MSTPTKQTKKPNNSRERSFESGFLDFRSAWALAILFLGILAFAGLDLITDFRHGTTLFHVLVEGSLFVTSAVGLFLMVFRIARLRGERDAFREEASQLSTRLAATLVDSNRWREEARHLVQGLGVAIDEQFERWDLSPAEKEVGLLLLKGLSHKDIAHARDVSEATARQQARSVYRKAGLTGRADLSAFFLEDLLVPQGPTSSDPDETNDLT